VSRAELLTRDGSEQTAAIGTSTRMTLKEKLLYHQIHPLKLAADIGCERVSLYLFWQRKLFLGLTTHFIPPIVASLLLIRYADLEGLKNSTAGAYIQRYMTRNIEGIRFAGDIVMMLGAWFQKPSLTALGLSAIILA
jgi:hypothetical protein